MKNFSAFFLAALLSLVPSKAKADLGDGGEANTSWRRSDCGRKYAGEPHSGILASVTANATVADFKGYAARGLRVCRLNLSHFDVRAGYTTVDRIGQASQEMGRGIGILWDLQGPKIRIELPSFPRGQEIPMTANIKKIRIFAGNTIAHDDVVQGSTMHLPISQDLMNHLIGPLGQGHQVFFADGNVECRVSSKGENEFTLDVLQYAQDFKWSGRKGMNFPDTEMTMSPLQPRDKLHLLAGLLTGGIHHVAFSFVRRAQDVIDGRELLRDYLRELEIIKKGFSDPQTLMASPQHRKTLEMIREIMPGDAPFDDKAAATWLLHRLSIIKLYEPLITAKIELPSAMDDIENIADAADALQCSRGDLMVEVGPDNLLPAVLTILEAGRKRGKSVTVATGLLAGIITGRVTQSNAIDSSLWGMLGADLLMMSDETVQGEANVAIDQLRRQILAGENSPLPFFLKEGAPESPANSQLPPYAYYSASPGLPEALRRAEKRTSFVFCPRDRPEIAGTNIFHRGVHSYFLDSSPPQAAFNGEGRAWFTRELRSRNVTDFRLEGLSVFRP